ncbi:MAG: cytochrome c [Weeksellaceae bacterium]|jgi:nitric oxide reductase subunit C|nr:cytochrome c [Weeksellaceae bacterium]
MKSDKFKLSVLVVLVVSFLAYSFELYVEPPPNGSKKVTIGSPEEQGKMLWQQKNCTSCHQLYGLGGHLGPDLTHVSSQRSPEHIAAFLMSGTIVMPNYHFSQEEINALMAFLKSVDESGNGDPRTFKLNLDGTISQKNN